jgi:hypothetical protein
MRKRKALAVKSIPNTKHVERPSLLIKYLRELPMFVAYVDVDGRSGEVLLMSRSRQPLMTINKEPTPNWLNFNLEDYDLVIECCEAIEEQIDGRIDLKFRFDMSVMR